MARIVAPRLWRLTPKYHHSPIRCLGADRVRPCFKTSCGNSSFPVARISAVGENLGQRDGFAPISDVARISAAGGENLSSRGSFATIVDAARKFFWFANIIIGFAET